MITKLTYYPYSLQAGGRWKRRSGMRSIYAYSDTQVFGEYPSTLLSYYKNHNIHIVKQPGDDEVMKQYPVDCFVQLLYVQLRSGG